jgi:hypothetical protein
MDDLTTIKDDMIAFIEGHGMHRFRGYVGDDVQSIAWDTDGNQDSWKDFVELAKNAGATFLTMNASVLTEQDVDFLVDTLRSGDYINEEDVEEARWLRSYVGKTGFVQLGWPYQGVVFVCEVSTEWYEQYQRLLDLAEEFGGFAIDEADQEDEH